jgi:flagellar biosynthesis protein FlhF
MRIKSYFSQSVKDAMAQAAQEMGSEAMLLNSRKASAEMRHLGEYEVVFGTDGDTPAPAQPVDSGAPEARQAAPAQDRLTFEVSDLKRELEGMRRALTRTAFSPSQWLGASTEACDAYAALTAGEMQPELAREVVQSAGVRTGEAEAITTSGIRRSGGAAFRSALAEELESRFTVEPVLGRGEARPRIVSLVGPAGSGKTTTLVKLAVNYGLACRRPVMLLSMDTYRVAAAEQLRSYAMILGVGFQLLETVTALAQAIEENRSKELILIDTPGLGAGDLDGATPLARFLSTRSDIDTQLVLPSSMKGTDMARTGAAFDAFRPQRLLFTKLDETVSFGPLLGEAVRGGKPVSFFTTGQRIPEDLETASRKRLVELVLAGSCARVRTAA